MLKAFAIYKNELFQSPIETVVLGPTTRNDEKWEVYRDVVFAATQGRLLLISEDEVNRYKEGNILCERTIKDRSDIPTCRNIVKSCLENREISNSQIMSWLLALSEAITNTIKHAEEGKMTLIEDLEKNEIRFVIDDNGPGFQLDELPRATLLAGYSTKKSMGQGFTLMMKMAKQLLLYSSPKGSILILVFDMVKEKERNHTPTG
nr:ATP-binding protein [Fredinandcohnia sp. SECRCQ15]